MPSRFADFLPCAESCLSGLERSRAQAPSFSFHRTIEQRGPGYSGRIHFPPVGVLRLFRESLQYATAVKNLLFWLRLAVSWDVNVEHRFFKAII